jgi:hypothetical protein
MKLKDSQNSNNRDFKSSGNLLRKSKFMQVTSVNSNYPQMKQKKLIMIAGLLVLLIGCDNYYMTCSLNPFYLEKNILLESSIEGSWVAKANESSKHSGSSTDSEIWGLADTTSTWTIKRAITKWVVKDKLGIDSTTFKPENYYIAKLTRLPDSTSYEFRVVLFGVKNGLYADFISSNKEGLIKSKLSSNSFFEVHTLARVLLSNKKIELSWLGADSMKEMIEKKRVRVNYLWVKEAGRFVLTASSNELTSMIDRYGDQSRFIDWEKQKAQLELTQLN